MNRFILIVFILVIFFLGIALFQLDSLPGEWFGDISNLHEYVLDIQKGKWPISYRQGVGPLYHYLITPVISLTPQRYINYKYISVIGGVFSIICIVFFVKEIINEKTALITGCLVSFSFWLLVWSRLGNLHAFIPGLVSLSFFYYERFKKTNRSKEVIIGMALSSLGMFLYIPLVLLPFTYLLVVTIHIWKQRSHILFTKILFKLIAVIVLFSLLFCCVILVDPSEFIHPKGYMSEKMASLSTMNPQSFITNFFVYGGKTLGMFFYKGDSVFRVNVPGTPIIDSISSVFLLIGLVVFFKQKKYRQYIFPLIILPIPAIFPSLKEIQIPSSTRTIVLLPFVYLFIGYGLTSSLQIFPKKISIVIFSILIGCIGFLNLKKYFIEYPKTLPNKNIAYGKIIAEFIDALPPSTSVYLADCCWGAWGQPEPKGIYFQLKNKRGRETLLLQLPYEECYRFPRESLIIDSGKTDICKGKKTSEKLSWGSEFIARITKIE